MNKLLTFDTVKQQFWFQQGSNRFQVGEVSSSLTLDILIKHAKSDGAIIIDTTNVDKTVMKRLIHTYFNRRGYVNDTEEYIEGLLLNGAEQL